MKKAVTKHYQLATTGRAEGLCHGGMAKMASGGKVEHTHVKIVHKKGVRNHLHVHHVKG